MSAGGKRLNIAKPLLWKPRDFKKKGGGGLGKVWGCTHVMKQRGLERGVRARETERGKDKEKEKEIETARARRNGIE